MRWPFFNIFFAFSIELRYPKQITSQKAQNKAWRKLLNETYLFRGYFENPLKFFIHLAASIEASAGVKFNYNSISSTMNGNPKTKRTEKHWIKFFFVHRKISIVNIASPPSTFSASDGKPFLRVSIDNARSERDKALARKMKILVAKLGEKKRLNMSEM